MTNDDDDNGDIMSLYDYDFELKKQWESEAAEERRKEVRLQTLNASTLGRNPYYVHNASFDERLGQIEQATNALISRIDNKDAEIAKITMKNRQVAKQKKVIDATLNLADKMFGQEKSHTVEPLL